MTFSLDEPTAKRLKATAQRLSLPQSHVVREAIRDYAARADRLSEEERSRLLALFDDLVPQIHGKDAEDVDEEIRAVRAARRGGGRASQSEEPLS